MAESRISLECSWIDPKIQSSILARVYAEILRWPPPEERSAAPDDLEQEKQVAQNVMLLNKEVLPSSEGVLGSAGRMEVQMGK